MPGAEVFPELDRAGVGRTIYISRHGESMYNLEQRLGGNPDLSPRGQIYACELGKLVNAMNIPNLKVWTSNLSRTHQTAAHITAPKEAKSALNEISSDPYDGLSYTELEALHPQEFAMREEDKFNYRYPEGESYRDLCDRLTPILPEMNNTHNLFVVSHQAVIRCIIAAFLHTEAEDIPYIKVPLHSLLKLTCQSDGSNSLEIVPLKSARNCVDTYRPKRISVRDSLNEEDTLKGEKSSTAKHFEEAFTKEMAKANGDRALNNREH